MELTQEYLQDMAGRFKRMAAKSAFPNYAVHYRGVDGRLPSVMLTRQEVLQNSIEALEIVLRSRIVRDQRELVNHG